uniref:Uncharacterized protein n=1 Tax=Timema tahoe TaxID=61484 RepID=A0A7R9IMB0_9NEOP|nr:unnamed protein product [Timema tahoe]
MRAPRTLTTNQGLSTTIAPCTLTTNQGLSTPIAPCTLITNQGLSTTIAPCTLITNQGLSTTIAPCTLTTNQGLSTMRAPRTLTTNQGLSTTRAPCTLTMNKGRGVDDIHLSSNLVFLNIRTQTQVYTFSGVTSAINQDFCSPSIVSYFLWRFTQNSEVCDIVTTIREGNGYTHKNLPLLTRYDGTPIPKKHFPALTPFN